jgi:hypothetical protein
LRDPHDMDTEPPPEDTPRQDRYCPVCGHTTPHWGPRTTVEDMVADRDMRPSGSIEAWICGDCGNRENVIASPEPTPPEQSRADLERWEEEGGLPGPD